MNEYTLSNKTGNLWTIGFPLSVVLTFVCAYVYAYIDYYNPLVYFTAVAWFFYGGSLSIILGLITKVSNCRNSKQAQRLGLITGLLAIHFSWATFGTVFLNANDYEVSILDYLFNPFIMFELAGALSEEGWYSIFGLQVSGTFAWIIYLIEAGGLFIFGLAGGSQALHEKVFCEKCSSWAKDVEYNVRVNQPDGIVLTKAQEGSVEALLECYEVPDHTPSHIRINLNVCESCNELATLDFDQIIVTINDKGEPEEEAEDLSKVFMVEPNVLSKFLEKQFATQPTLADTVE